MFLQIIHYWYIYVYKQDLPLNNQQGLMCHKIQLLKTIRYEEENSYYFEEGKI